MYKALLSVASLAGIATAMPAFAGSSSDTSPLLHALQARTSTNYTDWQPAQPGEARGPCPGLNALANHGICPRDGRNYTMPVMMDCIARGLNLAPDFILVVGSLGFASNPAPNAQSFDLDQLGWHDHSIECDASLSRADNYTGNDYSFNKTIWDSVLAYFPNDTVSLEQASKAIGMRKDYSFATNPTFQFDLHTLSITYLTSAIWQSVLGNPVTGEAPVEYVRSLFEQEKLPYELGWRPAALPLTIVAMEVMVLEMDLLDGAALASTLKLANATLHDTLTGASF